jgi:hypothetical protein
LQTKPPQRSKELDALFAKRENLRKMVGNSEAEGRISIDYELGGDRREDDKIEE